MKYRKPKVSCRLTRLTIPSDCLTAWGKQFPSYVGQSVNVASRWETYFKSAIYPGKKFKNALDKLPRKNQYWIGLRLIDWGIHKDSLNNLERCRIAQLKPTLNSIDYGFDLSYCDRPIRFTRLATRVSGIYQIIAIPKTVLKIESERSIVVPDLTSHLSSTLPHYCNRDTLWVATEKLGFHHL